MRLAQILDLFGEDSWRNVYAGELEVRPTGAPTTRPDREAWAVDKPLIFGELFETAPYGLFRSFRVVILPDREDATNAAAERIWPPHVLQSPAFSLLLGRAHLAIEPELVVHAERAERRAGDRFRLPALDF